MRHMRGAWAWGAIALGACALAGCGGEVTPDPARENAALVKSAVRAALDASTAARAGERAGEHWRVRVHRPIEGIGREEAIARLQGPRQGWPRLRDFAPATAPDGPGGRTVILRDAPLLGYPGVRASGWVATAMTGRLADLDLTGSRTGSIAVVRARREVQVVADVAGQPVVLSARMRGARIGRFTQEVSPRRCDIASPEWANLRATITSAGATSTLLGRIPRRAWAQAADLPLATGRQPYVPIGARVAIRGKKWSLAVRGPLGGSVTLQRALPDGSLRGCG